MLERMVVYGAMECLGIFLKIPKMRDHEISTCSYRSISSTSHNLHKEEVAKYKGSQCTILTQ